MPWSTKDEDRLIIEKSQGKGLHFFLAYETKEQIQSYCITNYYVMGKQHDQCMEAKNTNGTLSNIPMQSWILEAMLATRINSKKFSIDEMDFSL